MLSGSKILHVQRSAHRDGSAISGLMNVKELVSAGANVIAVFGHEGPVQEDYREVGCEVMTFPHGDWLRAGGQIRSLRRVSKELLLRAAIERNLSDIDLDLVYVNSLVSMSFARFAKRRRIPCIWHIRELFSDVGGEMVIPACGGKKLVRHMVSTYANQLVVNSNAVADNILGTKLKRRAKLIYNAVDIKGGKLKHSGEDLRESLGICEGDVVIGVPSTLRPMKGQEFLIRSLPRIASKIPDVVVAMLGHVDTEYGNKMVDLVNSLGLHERVRFAGTSSCMRQFYEMCDVICVPSRAEPFGRVVIESFYANRPVVASSVGGVNEIICHEENGLLFRYGDEAALASCLSRFASDTELRERVVESAYRCAQRHYTEERYRSEVLDIVSQAI